MASSVGNRGEVEGAAGHIKVDQIIKDLVSRVKGLNSIL